MSYIYEKFADIKTNEKGVLKEIVFKYEDNFNFAYDVVDELAKKIPNKKALMWVGNDFTEKEFTFSDISKYSSKTANYFKSLGINKGDRVLIILKRHYQFWFTMIALHKIGAIAIPATNQLVEKDLVYRFNAAGVKAIICTADGEISQHVDDSQKSSPTLKVKILVNSKEKRNGWYNFDDGIKNQSEQFIRPIGDAELKANDPTLMFFTSGTTGYPKIAVHSFTYPLGHIVTAKMWHNVDPDGIHLAVSDTGWGKALWGKLYGQWLCEACVFVYDYDRFNADTLLKMFAKYNITTFCAPPTIYRFFIKEDLSKYDLSNLKYATIAGEALNPEVYNQFYKATGLKLMEGFGQTECTLAIGNFIGTEPKVGSMGKPNPEYEIHLLNKFGTDVSTGEVGEICISTKEKTPVGLYLGYYLDKEKTKEAWHDGFYHSGDMAWNDEDGYFWYVGRIDDLIKSSGYRIGPFEIESVIMELPYVLECAITGVPDPIRGQVVKATIVLTKNQNGSDELKKEIQEYVKVHTAPYKYPRVVEFVQDLPKTISGKIKRADIRKENNN